MGATPEGASSGGLSFDALKHDGRILSKAGMALFPVGAGKRPFLKWTKGRKNYVLEHADADDLRDWLHDSRTKGWAALCGSLSGVMGLDAEAAGMAYPAVTTVLESLPAHCRRISPSGGAHAFIRLTDAPADYDWAGRSLAKVRNTHPVTGRPDGHTLLCEFRGHGQYAVVTGPGRPALPDDFRPVEMTVAEWEALIAPIEALHDPSIDVTVARAYATGPKGSTTAIGSGDTADVLRAAVVETPYLLQAMLDPGWEIVSVNGNRVTLKRPDYGEGTDANESGNVQDGAVVIFSETVPWLKADEVGKAMSLATAIARCWYDGDFGKAMSAIEEAAESLVVDGVAPAAGSYLAGWPTSLLEAVHAAREAYLDAAAALVSGLIGSGSGGGSGAGGSGTGSAPGEEEDPDEGEDAEHPLGTDDTDERPHLQVVGGAAKPDPGAAREAELARAAQVKFKELLVAERAREMLEDYRGRVREAEVRQAEADGENPLGWLAFDQDFWTMTPHWTFLVPDVLPEATLCAVYSGPGVGKSLLGLEWAAALATGRAFMGAEAAARRRVLYLDHENDPLLIRQRLEAMGYSAADDLSGLIYSMLGGWPPLDTAAGGERLLAEAKRLQVDLVIIDTTARVIEGEENTADTFHRLYRHALHPLKAAGVAVIRFDHTGKDATKGERGSSAKRGDVDLAFWMTASEDERYVRLERVKNRPHLASDPTLVLERRTSPRLEHVPLAGGALAVAVEAITVPDVLVDLVVAWVSGHPGASGTDIEEGLRGQGVSARAEAIRDARNHAITVGRLRVDMGPRNKKCHYLGGPHDDLSGFLSGLVGPGELGPENADKNAEMAPETHSDPPETDY